MAKGKPPPMKPFPPAGAGAGMAVKGGKPAKGGPAPTPTGRGRPTKPYPPGL